MVKPFEPLSAAATMYRYYIATLVFLLSDCRTSSSRAAVSLGLYHH